MTMTPREATAPHVAGIATANRYIPIEDGAYEAAMDTVLTQGAAPDAQILVMKVFGTNGGAYDSDYVAAVEDAIVLGCDSVNLSLGSAAPGFTVNGVYQQFFDALSDTGVVVVISAGNNSAWAASSASPAKALYADDVSFDTAGSPGVQENAFDSRLRRQCQADGFVPAFRRDVHRVHGEAVQQPGAGHS